LYLANKLFSPGPQRDFDRTEGIIDTVVGYSGSIDPINNPNPTYKNIKGCKLFAQVL